MIREIKRIALTKIWAGLLILSVSFGLAGCEAPADFGVEEQKQEILAESLEQIPEFSGIPYVVLNNNIPEFDETEYTTKSFEAYSMLDEMGRCGTAFACVGKDIMPTEERGSIGQVRPSGWQTVKYDHVDGKYLYNRCHLIAYQLTGENANEENLITGTRYMNTEGMLPFENEVADYVKETGNHVMYRVTPVFKGDNLVASGVIMEAWSVEDEGQGVCFHVYCYNNQPGVEIDYATGENKAAEEDNKTGNSTKEREYILNTSSRKFHDTKCSSVENIKEKNKDTYKGNREELLSQGYEPCGNCKP